MVIFRHASFGLINVKPLLKVAVHVSCLIIVYDCPPCTWNYQFSRSIAYDYLLEHTWNYQFSADGIILFDAYRMRERLIRCFNLVKALLKLGARASHLIRGWTSQTLLAIIYFVHLSRPRHVRLSIITLEWLCFDACPPSCKTGGGRANKRGDKTQRMWVAPRIVVAASCRRVTYF